MYRVRNEEVHRRAGIERELVSRVDQRVLRWFGDVARMDELVYSYTSVNGGSKWRACTVSFYGWCEGGL